jgi:predicted nucleic-acid-binding protein
MIGIDTNILLRLFARDDEAQYQSIKSHIDTGAWNEGAIVNPIVLAEATWVLGNQWKWSKSAIEDFVSDVLETSGFVVLQEAAVHRALADFAASKADFADCLIGRLNAAAGARTTMTFDLDAQGLSTFSKLA